MIQYLRTTPKWCGGHTVKVDYQQALEIYLRAKADGLIVAVTEDGMIIEPGTEYESRILGFKP